MFNKKFSIKQQVNIIGSGIAGLASAIRLRKLGFDVSVFEKNSYPGGKLSELKLGNYRFDKGPSLLTMPELIDELLAMSSQQSEFKYKKLDHLCHYFYEDGSRLNAHSDISKFAGELSSSFNESEKDVLEHLQTSKFYYDTTADLFLKQSLSQIKNFLNLKTLKGILNSPRLKLFTTMHEQNEQKFKNKKTVQLFDRYATYNGSNPYKAPALLNIIPHLEFGMGAYIPEKGMYDITQSLYQAASEMGVKFYFDHEVQKIIIENEKAKGIMANGAIFSSDLVLSDADIHVVYKRLLPESYTPKRILKQEKSSSAFVFYWGIKKEFNELDLHNILFSDNYREEFDFLFERDKPYHDPTIYINITSKYCAGDAPKGSENWFVMVNVPHHKGEQGINYQEELRANVIKKIDRLLQVDIESLIEVESTLSPIDIEKQTSSFGGSLYGNSSNNRFSAFLRHSNYSSRIKGLYFAGGSVHPGGGIPLCLLSAKIVEDIIKSKHAN